MVAEAGTARACEEEELRGCPGERGLSGSEGCRQVSGKVPTSSRGHIPAQSRRARSGRSRPPPRASSLAIRFAANDGSVLSREEMLSVAHAHTDVVHWGKEGTL